MIPYKLFNKKVSEKGERKEGHNMKLLESYLKK